MKDTMAVIFKDQTAASLDGSVHYLYQWIVIIWSRMVWYSLDLTCEWDWLQNIGCNLPSVNDFYRKARTSVTNHIVDNTSFSHYIFQDPIQSHCTSFAAGRSPHHLNYTCIKSAALWSLDILCIFSTCIQDHSHTPRHPTGYMPTYVTMLTC